MKEIKIRYSKQRELIFNNLKHRYDHPTAEMIYQNHICTLCVTVAKQSMILIIMIKKLLNNLKKRTSIILMLLISICQVSVKNV